MARISAGAIASSTAANGVSALGLAAAVSAFFSAAACCVLPLMLGWLGIGASGLALVVPYHRSLTIAAFFAVSTAWALYAWRIRTRGGGRSRVVTLVSASVLTLISTFWGSIEGPLMSLLT